MKTITTKSGFSFTPPEHILDDWDFLSVLGRMASPKLTDAGALSGYFELASALLGEDGVERLKAHVRKGMKEQVDNEKQADNEKEEEISYTSFKAMSAEIEEMLSELNKAEGNSSSSPE